MKVNQTIDRKEVDTFISNFLDELRSVGMIYDYILKENEILFYSAYPQELVEIKFMITGDENEAMVN